MPNMCCCKYAAANSLYSSYAARCNIVESETYRSKNKLY